MNQDNRYIERLNRSEECMRLLKEQVVPSLTKNIQQNMPAFVSAFKEIKALQVERQHELEAMRLAQETSLEKFSMVVGESQKRLSAMMQNITDMSKSLSTLTAETSGDIRSRELLLSALRDLQNTYLSELHMLLNL